MTPLVWLHLSDLHCGQPGERTRWGTAREALLHDLRAQAAVLGAPDFIFLTGDLAYAGQRREYEKLDGVLGELRAAVGGSPLIVPVPGNHDLARPAEGSVVARGFDHFCDDDKVRRDALKRKSDSHKLLSKPFAEYERWWNRSIRPQWEALRGEPDFVYEPGLFPGDFLLCVARKGLRLGIVGLNSAYLQLRGGEYQRRLAVEPEQLPGGDLEKLLRERDAALLLMHHPPDWLCERSQRLFEQYIHPPGRFTALLFGHMHASRSRLEIGGSARPRLLLQASSLFGLEHYGTSGETREAGYAWYTLGRSAADAGVLERFPRRGVLRDDGAFELDRDQSVREYPQRIPVSLRAAPDARQPVSEPPRRDPGPPLANPFTHAGRVTDPARFIGRKELLRQLFEELQKGTSRALIGAAQIGKSSLLSMVCKLGPARLGLPATRLVYLDMQVISDEHDFFEALCEGLGVQPSRGYKLERQLRGQRFIVCIDEIEKMHSARFPLDVREQLRGLADGDQAPLKLVIASRVPLDHLFPDSPGQTSPLSNLCPSITVPPLSAVECRELIRARLFGTGVEFSASEIDEIITRSGGMPVRVLDEAAALFARRGP